MSTLRTLAQRAKDRLRSLSGENDSRPQAEACLSARVQYAIIAHEKKVEDDPLYNKVKKILAKDPDATNALGQLVDQSLYKKMTPIEQEKYICRLSKRYVEIREHVLKDLSALN